MPRNFYYGKDADVVAGSANFSTVITAAPTSVGLTAAQATSYGTVNTALQTAWTAANTPATRTSVTIQNKDLAIRNMRAAAVPLAKIIYSTPTVTDGQLVSLGLLPRSSRSPVPPPAEAPVIDIVAVGGNTVKLRLHAAGESTRRGKPDGVDGASVFSFVGTTPPSEQSGWTFEGVTNKTVVDVAFPGTTAPGAKVWFTAMWFNARKQPGPAATAVTTNIPGGSAMAA